ncbi:MAG TPA: helix-turn-helix domain-containing protein, partial [Candidatus Methylomirabilis sp.]|nr:helix-turn-helix domain-containing protein [Candidatus Methylomirabilis sp.]
VLPDDLPLPIESPAEAPGTLRTPASADALGTRHPGRTTARRPRHAGRSAMPALSTLHDVEREQIIQALSRADGVQARAAALLGITPRQLGYRLRRHGIVRGFHLTGRSPARDA